MEKGYTPAQLALSWVLAQGDDVVPIPRTKQTRYLKQNVGSLSIDLRAADIDRLEKLVPMDAAQVDRYLAEGMKGVHV